MSDYIVSCCSTADLPKEMFEKYDIPYAQFSYFMDGQEYKDDLYQSISPEEFFKKIEDGAQPTTAQIAPEQYKEMWRPYLDAGKSVLHLALSSGISGTYQSSLIAMDEINEEYSDVKVITLDSLAASSGFGMLVVEAKERADAGISIDENAKWIEENKNKLHHWFFSTDLTSYIRGGRVSKVSGFVGSMLNICPLLNVNNEGKLIPRDKIRGKNKVIKEIFERMKSHARDGENYSGKVYMSHSVSEDMAKSVVTYITEYFKNVKEEDVVINNIGTVIGSHTGPGTVALFFWGDERTA